MMPYFGQLHPAVATWILGLAEMPQVAQPPILQAPSSHVLTIFLANRHWTCLAIVPQEAGDLHAVVFDGIPGCNTEVARQLSRLLDQPVAAFRERTLILQQSPQARGIIALQHAASVLRGNMTEVDEWIVSALARAVPFPPREIGFGGLSEEQTAQLSSILQEYGVPQDKLEERISRAIRKIGAGSLAQALKAPQPWPALKAASSKPASMYKWVHSDELTRHIEARASSRFGTSVHKPKDKKAMPSWIKQVAACSRNLH